MLMRSDKLCLGSVRWGCMGVILGRGPGGQVSSGLYLMVRQMAKAIIMVIKCILCRKVNISILAEVIISRIAKTENPSYRYKTYDIFYII